MKKTLTYRQLMADAEALYREPMKEAPFAAICEARKYIASRIDECVDRDQHLDVLEWDEYKEFKPMTKKEYESAKKRAKENYEDELKEIEKEWKEKGKYSPDYHKV